MTGPRLRLAFLLAGGVLLAALLARVDLGALREAVRRTAPAPLGAAVGFLGLNVLVKTGRWRWMIRRLTGRSLGLADATKAILAGVAAASFSPARTVDLAKPLLLRQRFDVALSTSTAAVLVERFM
ncbi:MAG TPA: lysylphosphatidylglycerol synthase domain-containing protein, partial [bacterium]|nr:lysylphosphatidylglycerol synthase domain-containing protein [bacterium]